MPKSTRSIIPENKLFSELNTAFSSRRRFVKNLTLGSLGGLFIGSQHLHLQAREPSATGNYTVKGFVGSDKLSIKTPYLEDLRATVRTVSKGVGSPASNFQSNASVNLDFKTTSFGSVKIGKAQNSLKTAKCALELDLDNKNDQWVVKKLTFRHPFEYLKTTDEDTLTRVYVHIKDTQKAYFFALDPYSEYKQVASYHQPLNGNSVDVSISFSQLSIPSLRQKHGAKIAHSVVSLQALEQRKNTNIDLIKANHESVEYVEDDFGYGCYLTTLVCDELGLQDDCLELATLRKFRDEYVLALPEGPDLQKTYRNLAPVIVRKIKTSGNPRIFASGAYFRWILPMIIMVKLGFNRLALSTYKQFTQELAKAL